jgi:hypothetical protein
MSQVGNSYFARVYASIKRTFQLSSTTFSGDKYPIGMMLRKFLVDSFAPYYDAHGSENLDIHWLSSLENQQLAALSEDANKKTTQKKADKEEDPIIPKKEFLKKYRCSYVVTDNRIHYVRPDLTLRPVTINNFPHFANALLSHNPNNKSRVNLPFSQLNELVTLYGGSMHLKIESKVEMRESFINGTAISQRYAPTFSEVVGKQRYNPLNYLYVGSQLVRGLLHTAIDQVTSLYYSAKNKLGLHGEKYPVIPVCLKTVITIGCIAPEVVCYVAAHPVATLWQGMKNLYRKITCQPSEKQNLITITTSPRSQVMRRSTAATTMQKTSSNPSLSQLITSSPSATCRSVQSDDTANTTKSTDQEKERILLQESLFRQKNLFFAPHQTVATRTLQSNMKHARKKSDDEKEDIVARSHDEPEHQVLCRA